MVEGLTVLMEGLTVLMFKTYKVMLGDKGRQGSAKGAQDGDTSPSGVDG
jgi:hypothetical protein